MTAYSDENWRAAESSVGDAAEVKCGLPALSPARGYSELVLLGKPSDSVTSFLYTFAWLKSVAKNKIVETFLRTL